MRFIAIINHREYKKFNMNNSKVIITGILGQDGYYLSSYLSAQGFDILGYDLNLPKDNKKIKNVKYFDADLVDRREIDKIIKEEKPSIVYNLAGISDVNNPFTNLDQLTAYNIVIPMNFMTAIENYSPCTKFCQASSCLVFAGSDTEVQNENTIRSPLLPYAYAKNYVDYIIKIKRNEKKLQFCSAIFYNHDSPHRGPNFFIMRLINLAKAILKNKCEKQKFGNLYVYRDIGYAKEYVEAFYLMSQKTNVDDYIVATGKPILLFDIVNCISNLANVDLMSYIIQNDLPHNEKKTLVGDPKKIFQDLDWKAKVDCLNLVKIIWDECEKR